MDIIPYLKLMVEKSASDLFLAVGCQVKIKLEGKITTVGKTTLTSDSVKAVAYGMMDEKQITSLEENLECDFAIPLEDKARFRVNVFFQRGEISLVLRLVPNHIPTLDGLNLPKVLSSLIMNKRGLILMVGGTGSGKSTTLAAMINHRNKNMDGHILTIEDPVEFSHPHLKSIVSQREIGVDTKSYENALKASLREAPDVILIGEIRDRTTMEAALGLANTGHLALSTLHANNSNQALDKIINFFPEERRRQLLIDLSLNMRAVISQRLVPSVDGKRCAASEILINTPYIQELILKGAVNELKDAMTESTQPGMQTFDDSLVDLYKAGQIDLEEALSNADSRSNLENKISFG